MSCKILIFSQNVAQIVMFLEKVPLKHMFFQLTSDLCVTVYSV